MKVVLQDGIKKGDVYDVADVDKSLFRVILTENPYYKFAVYSILPMQTPLGERVATFIGMEDR